MGDREVAIVSEKVSLKPLSIHSPQETEEEQSKDVPWGGTWLPGMEGRAPWRSWRRVPGSRRGKAWKLLPGRSPCRATGGGVF